MRSFWLSGHSFTDFLVIFSRAIFAGMVCGAKTITSAIQCDQDGLDQCRCSRRDKSRVHALYFVNTFASGFHQRFFKFTATLEDDSNDFTVSITEETGLVQKLHSAHQSRSGSCFGRFNLFWLLCSNRGHRLDDNEVRTT